MAANVVHDSERDAQKKFWLTYGPSGTIDDMFLHSEGQSLDEMDRPEILDAMGSVEGKTVLELAAGIGRFTGCLAEKAKHVVTNDFMEVYVQRNREANGHHKNITFLEADATKMDFGKKAHDVIFVNWLLQYLTDAEVSSMLERVLAAMTDEGVFFVRESCNHTIGDRKREFDTTRFRNISEYFKFFGDAVYEAEDGKSYRFCLEKCGCLKTFVVLQNVHSQIWWKLTKVEVGKPNALQAVFNFYNKGYVVASEKFYGEGFTCPNGADGARAVLKKLNLEKGQSVLDIGCGLGAIDFMVAKEYGVNVLGLDIAPLMFMKAINDACSGRYAKDNGRVFFLMDDCQTCEFEDGMFDTIMALTSLVHIPDKPKLYKKILRWLKPGGQLLISEFCKKEGDLSADFAEDRKKFGFYFLTLEGYASMLKETGFTDVSAEDATESILIPSLYKELKSGQDSKEEIIKEVGEEAYDYAIEMWNNKINRATGGQLKYGLFFGRKPSS